MYLMLATRPDISAALNKVAQFSTNYDSTHWTAIKRIFRYLRGTSDITLTLGQSRFSRGFNNKIELTGSCDADWGGDLNDRRSTTGYIFAINNNIVSWQTHKQTSVATSSTQAEYQALSSATKEALWIRHFLDEIGFKQNTTQIQQDNQSAITLANNPTNHNRTKHIDIAHHFIREQIEQKIIELQYYPTSDILADIMTKPLGRIKFESNRESLGLRNIESK